ncbi:hypothetical protein HDV64DRAFT_215039 [Trichoderma sp. TUCIM 5745]
MHGFRHDARETSRKASVLFFFFVKAEQAAHAQVRVIVAVCRIRGLLWTIQRRRTRQGESAKQQLREQARHTTGSGERQ